MNGKKILFGAACDGLLLFLMRGAYKPTEEFPETFYKEVISKVILYRDTHIEFKLQNGQIV